MTTTTMTTMTHRSDYPVVVEEGAAPPDPNGLVFVKPEARRMAFGHFVDRLVNQQEQEGQGQEVLYLSQQDDRCVVVSTRVDQSTGLIGRSVGRSVGRITYSNLFRFPISRVHPTHRSLRKEFPMLCRRPSYEGEGVYVDEGLDIDSTGFPLAKASFGNDPDAVSNTI
jgi:hypothetical protein